MKEYPKPDKKTSVKTIQKRILNADSLLIDFYGIPQRNKQKQPALDVLIGTVLSQNTNDKNSYKAFRNLKDNFPSWQHIQKLSTIAIEKEIKIAGLGKQKAAAIKAILNYMEDKGEYSLEFLSELDQKEAINLLTSFDGVGVKTASCVMLFSLNQNICPVDTHVNRTVNRIGIADFVNPEKTFWFLYDLLPADIAHRFHTNLIRLGREFCVPTKPACKICPLKKICKYELKYISDASVRRFNDFMLLDSLH